MKKFFKILLLVIILVIIVSGILLMIYRLPVLDYMSKAVGISNTEAPSVDSISQTEMIDVNLIKSKRLDTLVNQAPVFDFDNICRRSKGLQPAAGGNCSLGNGQPLK